MAIKTPDEILEEQRAERTKEYAANIHSLHLKEMDTQSRIDNLQKTLDDAFANRKKELDTLENDARARIASLDNKSSELSTAKKQADATLKEAEDILAKANSDASAHQRNLDNHLNSVDEIKADLASQYAVLNDEKLKAKALVDEAEVRIKAAIAKESEIETKANQLVHISSNVDEAIKKQKSEQEKLEQIIADLNSKKEELNKASIKNSEELGNLIIIRDSLEAEKKSQINRKLEISEREEELKQKNVKCALDLQRLQDKEKEIAAQAGKLNELKNNVESLMKLQEKGA